MGTPKLIKLRKIRKKRAQSDIIVTVLLILVGIAAVVIVSTFVINLVKNNLKGTECFDASGQLTIKTEDSLSYFNKTSKILYLVVKRGNKEFNLTGIAVVYGNEAESKKISLMLGERNDKVLDSTLLALLASISLPEPGESTKYRINTTGSGLDVQKVSVTPLLYKSSGCEISDEKQIAQVEF